MDSERYRRHLVLREVGPEGQARLLRATARVIGEGRAAEEAATYLVAAGVGRVVLEPALHEQMRERLSELNPDVAIAEAAIMALEVAPSDPSSRAEGARAALLALLELSGAAPPRRWREDPL